MLETVLAQPETARLPARRQDPYAHRLGQGGRHHPGQLCRAVSASVGERHSARHRPLWTCASAGETPGVCAHGTGVPGQAVTSTAAAAKRDAIEKAGAAKTPLTTHWL